MNALASLPIIKEIIGWLRNHEVIELLKGQVEEKNKELEKLRRRLKKLEKLQ